MKTFNSLLLLLTLACSATWASDYDEAVDGDLSNNEAAPTMIVLEVGANTLAGSTTQSPLDRDFATVRLGAGERINSIRVLRYELIDNPSDGGSLLALQTGAEISDITTGAGLLGNVIFGVNPGTAVGEELLDDLGQASLRAPEYTLWIQNTGADTRYQLQINVVGAAPPEPTPARAIPVNDRLALMLLLALISGLGARALRRS